MGWGGHVQDMINRIKANNALKMRKREIYDRIKEAHYKSAVKHTPLHFDDAHFSEEEHLALIKSLRKERTTGLIIKSVILIVSVVVVVLFGYYLFYYKYRS